ncbi:hypothetical protein [Actinophytocola algeriensis]|uniref:Uncharacterized protein n=1 Tax=Actinophytocola algeriensis TaxID=1768010 RepID=A0A7W7VJW5_9PSEU|nr:hypothetical protein [Actinophytocola algeriensis]MBB4912719.1 hypothetical protein [Actinophytocola algeriensis]MBE1473613.1 hypothetical protein [Actinophytocola algeriensis]
MNIATSREATCKADPYTPRTGTGATLAVRTAVATTIRVAERGTGLILLQVTSPASAPPPHDGAVMQVDYDDGQSDLVTGPVENNGFARLEVRPVPGQGIAHFSGTRGYAPSFDKITLLNDS